MHIPRSTLHGYPRMGPNRELKFAIEEYWSGKSSQEALDQVARTVREQNWTRMATSGIDLIPANDFSLYDHVLDMAVLLNIIPERYQALDDGSLTQYFAMARGMQANNIDVAALEMTKWFDTNYHQIVPELEPSMQVQLHGSKPFDELREIEQLGLPSKCVLLGPITFLLRSKASQSAHAGSLLSNIDSVLGVYIELMAKLAEQKVEWVQLDEPSLVEERTSEELEIIRHAYHQLATSKKRPSMCVSTYFESIGDSIGALLDTPVEAIGLDFCSGPENVSLVKEHEAFGGKILFAGVVDGRNVWINRLRSSMELLLDLSPHVRGMTISSSCSFLHLPVSLDTEHVMGGETKRELAFAQEKLLEIVTLANGLEFGIEAIAPSLEANDKIWNQRSTSTRAVDPHVRDAIAALTPADFQRASAVTTRKEVQQQHLPLPFFPTTTIGSFPQTPEIRQARMDRIRGKMSKEDYDARIRQEVAQVVAFQDSIGIDVIVHGESERNDMVQFFAEQLNGFTTTQNGWVQSYGTRCTRPPIILGDVSRADPMTIDMAVYTQTLTKKPVKGILTGPVTMLKWSFQRDDLSSMDCALQIGLALRDEVQDLEHVGIPIIQVDEPAFREALPLKRAKQAEYLKRAAESFRLVTSAVRDETQIHTHMCYSEFAAIMSSLRHLDVDVISFEAARSNMELLTDFLSSDYEGDIGPGVYDIHSPRTPSVPELLHILEDICAVIPAERIWVNPDCGLKTRKYGEVEQALKNLVEAAGLVRDKQSVTVS